MYVMEAQSPTRPRRARGSLTPDEILDAAEAVAARTGEPLTVRAVAAELGASAMALYRYFPTKDDLVDALIDRVLERVPAPSPGDWLDELRELALAHARVLAEHPWAIAPLFASPSPGVGAAILGERFLAILARGGLTGEAAVAAFTGILALNYGRTAFAAGDGPVDLPPLPAEHFPHSAASAAALAGYAGDANYRRVLDLMLDGIRASAA